MRHGLNLQNQYGHVHFACKYIAYLLVLARIFHDRNFDVGPTLQALTAS